MVVIRITLLLVVLGGLALLLAQNWLPGLQLVFMGVKTQPLPLALWILISLAAGANTSLFITSLFKLSNYFAHSAELRRKVAGAKSAQTTAARQTAASRDRPNTDSTNSDAADDWGSNSTDDDDWDFEEDTDKTQNSTQNTVKDSTTYEANTEPKSGSRSGSVYSYNYREPRNSGVGRTESVYDAEYRVITPPYKQTDTNQDKDDWGLEDDDDDKQGTKE